MAKYVITFFICALFTNTYAQHKKRDSGIILLLGPSVTYQMGNSESENSYNENLLSWQFDGQFGFISTRNQTNRGNMLMAFGSIGNAKATMAQDIFNASVFADKPLEIDQNFNLYYTLEGGMIVMKFLRLSGGMGKQNYTDGEGSNATINHYIGTAGLNFDFGAVNLGLNASALTGNELEKTIVRFSAGFLVKF